MPFRTYLTKITKLSFVFTALTLVACGGGGGGTTSNNPPTPAEVAAITPAQIGTLSDAQFAALGLNLKYLSDAALQVLTRYTNSNRHIPQIPSISADQIALFTPAQIRMIGAAGPYGTVITSQITYLNAAAWAALANNPLQVAAITGDEITTIQGDKIAALGTNIQYLSDSAFMAFTRYTATSMPIPKIQSITAEEMAVLTPAQVRLIGAGGPYGTVVTSQITYLNDLAWAALASNPLQVAAITGDEIGTIQGDKIVALGTNIQYLSDTALMAFTRYTAASMPIPKIQSITAAQIAVLTPAQVRLIGAGGPFGTVVISQITYLNDLAWAALASNPLQVAAITGDEIGTIQGDKIAALGTNIQYLSDSAFMAFTRYTAASMPIPKIQSITAEQITVLTPAQISIIAGTMNNTGISYLNSLAFGALSPAQIAILTVTQKATLTPAQHTTCGC